jgi:exonuclease I
MKTDLDYLRETAMFYCKKSSDGLPKLIAAMVLGMVQHAQGLKQKDEEFEIGMQLKIIEDLKHE